MNIQGNPMTLDDVFSPGGPLESNLSFYTYRESQMEMAALIEKAFGENKIAALEAGTGIGKSFAYLVPSFLEILNDKKKRIVVATSTITLENQLYEKDIPLINKALNANIEIAILYGRSNYLCIEAFKEKEAELGILALDDKSDFARFRSWVYSTKTGSQSELKSKAFFELFNESSSDAQTCKGPKCEYFNDCFFYEARKKARKARIIVTNHHLFILDGKNRDERNMDYDEDMVLPQFDYAILDEAHHLDNEAERLLSSTYNYEQLRKSIDILTKKDKKLGGISKAEYLKDYAIEKGAIKKFLGALKEIKSDQDVLDQALSSMLSLITRENEILLDRNLAAALSNIKELSEELGRKIKNASFSLSEKIHVSDDVDDVNVKLAFRNIENMLSHAEVLSTFFDTIDYRKSVPHFIKERNGHYSMVITPMDIGSKLKTVFFDKIKSVILSSATLTVGRDFNHFLSSIGLDSRAVITARFDSPFNFKRNLMLLVPRNGLSYNNNDSTYYDYTATEIAKAINISSGGALVLFTSFEMLSYVTDKVKEMVPSLHILKQDGKKSRNALLEEFKTNKDASLFATASFWEGIDAPGDTLRLLIIVKLPFSPPSSPMMKARSAVLKSDNKSSFAEITLPDAVIKFKQGIGRLIRSEEDRGAVLVLDGRLATKNYRFAFIQSIPECYMPEDAMLENIEEKLESFLY